MFLPWTYKKWALVEKGIMGPHRLLQQSQQPGSQRSSGAVMPTQAQGSFLFFIVSTASFREGLGVF